MSYRSTYQGSLDNVKIICGRSNEELGKLISDKLKIPLVDCCLEDFANKELRVEIYNNLRGRDIFILQTGSSDDVHSINDHIMELVAIASACRLSSARTVTALVPYYPYSRSDKKDNPRVPIMGRVFADMLVGAGVDRIVSMDLHAGQIQGFSSCPFDNLFCLNLFVSYMKNTLFKGMTQDDINEKYVLVSPDQGGINRVKAYAKKLEMNYIFMHKQRDYTQKSVVMKSMIIGDIKNIEGKKGIIIDDMIDTMGTMTAAATELLEQGMDRACIIATHGIFSGPAFKRIMSCDAIDKVIVTNTLPQMQNMEKCGKLVCIDTSDMSSEVIRRLIEGGSLSELFE